MNKTDIEKYVKTEQKNWDSIYSNRFDKKKTIKTIKQIVTDILVAVGSDTHNFAGMQDTITNLEVVNDSLAKNEVKFYVGNKDMVETFEWSIYLEMIEPAGSLITRIKELFS